MNEIRKPVIEKIFAEPLDYMSPLLHKNPGFELFSSRNHFGLNFPLRYLAVAMLVENPTYYHRSPRPVNGTFTAVLRHAETGEMITARTFSLRIDGTTETQYRRIDMRINSQMISYGTDYKLQILDSYKENAVEPKTIRFFNAGDAPWPLLDPQEAWFECDDDYAAGKLARVDSNVHFDAKFKMRFKSAFPAEQGVPELTVRMVYDNECERHLTLLADADSDVEEPVFTLPLESDFFANEVAYIEMSLFGYAVAGLPVCFDNTDVEGVIPAESLKPIAKYTLEKGKEALALREASESHSTRACEPEGLITSARAELDALVGLDSVKERINSFVNLARLNKMRDESGIRPLSTPLHSIFTGAPGTGKTTVAKMLGRLLQEAGVLSSGHVVVRERATLLGRYYNSEGENTLAAIEEAQGGILFIDEAYQLFNSEDPRDPGRFVLDSLMTALSDTSRRDWMVILAGYPEPTLELLNLNKGLKSRFPAENIFVFDDFTPHELQRIVMDYLAANQLIMTEEAFDKLSLYIDAAYRRRNSEFGNARFVINTIESRVLPALANRVAHIPSPTYEEMSTIQIADIPEPHEAV